MKNRVDKTNWSKAITYLRNQRAMKIRQFSLTTLLALVITSLTSVAVLARPDAVSLQLNPTPAILAGCGTVTVDIYINDVVNLYGASVQLSFDPNLLEVVDADPIIDGVQILPVNTLLYSDLIVRNTTDNTLGTIWYAATQLDPRPPSSGSGAIATITFRSKATGTSALTFTYSMLAEVEGIEIPIDTRTDGSVQTSGPSAPSLAIARLNSTTAQLTWGSVADVANYHLYRDTTPYFTPVDPAYQITTGLSYDDIGVLGDTVVQHYYTMRSACANGLMSDNSNRVGEYDWALQSASASNYNDISMVLSNQSITDAQSLAAYIGSSVRRILHYFPDTQSYGQYVVGFPGTNFSISTGEFLYLITNNTAPASFPMVGNVPPEGSISFSLISGSPAKYNFLSLPLDRGDLTKASQIVAEIGNIYVNRLLAYQINTQSYSQYIPGFPGTDFNIVPGEPFILILKTGAPSLWPIYP